ncbi:hypothetical protein [Streptomyces lavendulocolor]|uniref:hypothetical protein n=1 Tax=Streptomyces lavendulocolor TaxID=67316 RepID=UPI003C2F8BCE
MTRQAPAQTPPTLDLTPPPAAAPSPAPAPAPMWVSPVASWPSPLTDQTTQAPAADTGTKPRRSRAGGMPVGPVLASTGNATALTLTTAYQYGGPVAAATTGALMAAGATTVALRRRSTVRRSKGRRGASQGLLRGAFGGGSRGAAGASRLNSGGALRGATGGGRSVGPGATGRSSGGGWGAGAGRVVAPRTSGATHSASGASGAIKHGGAGGFGAGRRSDKSSGLKGGKHRRHDRQSGATGPGRHDKTPATTTPPGTGTGRHTRPGTSSAGGGHRAPGSLTKSNKAGGTIKAALGRATRAAGVGARAAGRLAAQGASAGWKMTAPARAAGRRKLAAATKAATAGLVRQIKKVPGALTDGLLATGAGVLSGLWNWSGKAALTRLRDVWKRRRARRAKNADTTDPSTTPDAPEVADTVRRPTHPTTTPKTTFGGPMSGGHHFIAPAMEMARIAASYDPKGMLQVGEDFVGLSEALNLHAEAMKVTVENADAKQPLAPQIIELMRQIHGLQLKAAELAQELKPAFEQLHQVDLDRLRNPRKGVAGEAMWDISHNL